MFVSVLYNMSENARNIKFDCHAKTLNINSRNFERDRVSYIDMVIFCCEVL